MKLISRILKLNRQDYYERHLSIINNLIPANLTSKEIEVLAAFMAQDKNLIEDEVFNPVTRKKVRKLLKLSPGGLGNHLAHMVEKGVLTRNEITNTLSIKSFLIPEEKVQGYQIKIINNGEVE